MIVLMKTHALFKSLIGFAWAMTYGVHIEGAKLRRRNAKLLTLRWIAQKLLSSSTAMYIVHSMYFTVSTIILEDNAPLVVDLAFAQNVSIVSMSTAAAAAADAAKANVSLSLILWWGLAILMVRNSLLDYVH